MVLRLILSANPCSPWMYRTLIRVWRAQQPYKYSWADLWSDITGPLASYIFYETSERPPVAKINADRTNIVYKNKWPSES